MKLWYTYPRMAEPPKIAKVEVNRDVCIGAASCVAITSAVFELDAEGKAVVKDITAADSKTLLAAAESCPTKAISLYDEAGNKVYP